MSDSKMLPCGHSERIRTREGLHYCDCYPDGLQVDDTAQPAGVEGVPEKVWIASPVEFKSLISKGGPAFENDVEYVRADIGQRLSVHEPTSVIYCNDSRCPVGKTIEGWPHRLSTPNCIYSATLLPARTPPTNIAERARQAVDALEAAGYLPEMCSAVCKDTMADIIAGEFGGVNENNS